MAGSERKDKRGVQQLLLLLLLLPLGGVVGLRQNVIINRHFLGDIFATSGKSHSNNWHNLTLEVPNSFLANFGKFLRNHPAEFGLGLG